MNILEKYRFYKNIIKQKPLCVIVYNDKYMIYDTDSYKIDIYSIKKSDFLYIKPRFFKPIFVAEICEKNKKNIVHFNGLIAKKLFEYGKKYQK